MSEKDPHRYDDMIHMPHFKSKKRPQMSLHDRAAQFAPFAALTGYDESISETARQTERQIRPGEAEKAELDRRFRILSRHIGERPEVTIRHFVPDDKKSGGAYETARFRVRGIDLFERALIAEDREKYGLDYILEIDSEIFSRECEESPSEESATMDLYETETTE
ncbi:MAG: hypothetical protein IKF46_04280 [Erysipelotrichaceae bacterium]|nr:hypothetical protein [Erysipelotrichaceae bacterium]